MNEVDRWFARLARGVARRSSRRGFLARLGTFVLGTAAFPLLPVARSLGSSRPSTPGEPDPSSPVGDPSNCEYWRHCAIDGFLCSCCGARKSCPPARDIASSGSAPVAIRPTGRSADFSAVAVGTCGLATAIATRATSRLLPSRSATSTGAGTTASSALDGHHWEWSRVMILLGDSSSAEAFVSWQWY
jgi:hypothetical protein